MDSTAAVPWLKLWLAEQGLGARDSILGFANSVSEIEYILLPSRKMTETFFKQYMTKNQRQPKQNSSARPTKDVVEIIAWRFWNCPFLSISASCPLLFYQKWSHFKGIQPKLGSRFVFYLSVTVSDFAISDKIHVSFTELGCLLRRPRESGHYKIRTWFMRATGCSVRQIYKYFCRDFFLYCFSFFIFLIIYRSNSY